jgi:hypothetical protein
MDIFGSAATCDSFHLVMIPPTWPLLLTLMQKSIFCRNRAIDSRQDVQPRFLVPNNFIFEFKKVLVTNLSNILDKNQTGLLQDLG